MPNLFEHFRAAAYLKAAQQIKISTRRDEHKTFERFLFIHLVIYQTFPYS